jgi:hypothetical protein
MTKNFMQDEGVYSLFKIWIQSPDPMLLKHPADRQMFFKFIKACFASIGGHPYGKKIDLDIFNKYLIEALKEHCSEEGDKFTEEVNENIRHEAVVLFERIIEYEDTKNSYLGRMPGIGTAKKE